MSESAIPLAQALALYRTMARIRAFENAAEEASKGGVAAFGVRLFERLPKRDMDERVEWALSRAALWDEVKDKLHQSGMSLSGGQQQRLCIARTIAADATMVTSRPERFTSALPSGTT